MRLLSNAINTAWEQRTRGAAESKRRLRSHHLLGLARRHRRGGRAGQSALHLRAHVAERLLAAAAQLTKTRLRLQTSLREGGIARQPTSCVRAVHCSMRGWRLSPAVRLRRARHQWRAAPPPRAVVACVLVFTLSIPGRHQLETHQLSVLERSYRTRAACSKHRTPVLAVRVLMWTRASAPAF